MLEQFLLKPYAVTQLFDSKEINKIDKLVQDIKLDQAKVFNKSKGVHYSSVRTAKAGYLEVKGPELKVYKKILELKNENWGQLGRLYKGRLQFIKYTHNSGFDWHVDAPFHSQLNNGQKTDRLLTAVIMLSKPNEYSGGQFEMIDFFGTKFQLKLKAGQLLVFPSAYVHRVSPVSEGTRKVLTLWLRGKSEGLPK